MKSAASGVGRISLLASGFCVFVLYSTSVAAEQWFLTPTASIRTFFDDNVRLVIDEPDESFGVAGRANLAFGRRTEVSEVGIALDLSSTLYSEVSDLDRTDGGLSFTSAYQHDRHRFGLDASFDYDSTITSEVSTSGRVYDNKRRARWLLNPSWSYVLTERASLEATLNYQDVAYENADRIALYDYSFVQADATASYAMTERLKLLTRINYDHYDAVQIDSSSESYGVEVGANYLLSETMTLATFAGVRRTQAEIPTWWGSVDEDSSGPLFQLEWRNRYELGSLSVTALRSMLPSSNGSLVDTTGVNVGLSRTVSPLWTLRFDAEGYRNQVSGSQNSAEDRKYLSLMPTISRRLTDAWSVDVSYRYRWQRYDADTESADSNALYLTLKYAAPQEPLKQWLRLSGS